MGDRRSSVNCLAFAAALIFVTAACGPNTLALRCDDRRIPADAVPVPRGFELLASTEVEPEGCGAGWSRHAVLGVPGSSDALQAFSSALTDDGWVDAPCLTDKERCFERGGYFLAAASPDDLPPATDMDAGPARYPNAAGDDPQVLVNVGPVAEH